MANDDTAAYQTLNRRGDALIEEARTKRGKEADELFRVACVIYGEALLLAARSSARAAAYDLACNCALEGDPDGCRRWLENANADLRVPTHE